MKKLYFWSIYSTVFIAMIASCFFFANRISAENSFVLPFNDQSAGLKRIILTAPEGKIWVNLPDDIRPGDTISGYIYAEPEGKTEAERRKNAAELIGYVVDIAGSRQTPWKKTGEDLEATVNFALTSGKVPNILLKSKTGATISTDPLPVQGISITMPPVSSPTTTDYQLPAIGQQGRPVIINSPESRFNGDFRNTSVKVGGKEALLLAESPRKAVVMVPEGEPGETEIVLNEGNVEKKASFRSVAAKLAASRLNLNKGGSTTVSVIVSGLRNLKDPLPVQLVTTGDANMQGGNIQNIIIDPGKINPEGIFTLTRRVTATKLGVYNVLATVMPSKTQDECECECKANKPAVTQKMKRARDGGGSTYIYAPGFTYKCAGSNCTAESTYAWSIGDRSTATYSFTKQGDELVVDVTGEGTLVITVTATVKCTPGGATCEATGAKTFKVKK